MLFELKLFSTPAVLLLLLVVIGLHGAAVLAKGTMSKVIGYVNIALHLLMFIPMLGAKFHIEEAVLVYLISFFAYTIISCICYKVQVKRASAEASCDDGTSCSETKEGEV